MLLSGELVTLGLSPTSDTTPRRYPSCHPPIRGQFGTLGAAFSAASPGFITSRLDKYIYNPQRQLDVACGYV